MSNVAALTSSAPALVESAQINLPATYEAARQALETCYELDECRNWEEKAKALAAYARMRDDDSLRVMAVRIADRAVRRYGELFAAMYPRQDEATRFGNAAGDAATGTPVKTRVQAAQESGTSPRQLHTALRVAAIPKPEFERQVESPTPPTITQLAEQGTAKRTVVRDQPSVAGMRTPGYKPQLPYALRDFAQFCEDTDAVYFGTVVSFEDRYGVLELATIAKQWLEKFTDSLLKDE